MLKYSTTLLTLLIILLTSTSSISAYGRFPPWQTGGYGGGGMGGGGGYGGQGGYPGGMSIMGGLTDEHPADNTVNRLVKEMSEQIKEKYSKNTGLMGGQNMANVELEALSYRTAVVAGVSYYIKVRLSTNPPEYIHVVIFSGFGGQKLLTRVENGHTAKDPIGF